MHTFSCQNSITSRNPTEETFDLVGSTLVAAKGIARGNGYQKCKTSKEKFCSNPYLRSLHRWFGLFPICIILNVLRIGIRGVLLPVIAVQ